MKVHKDARKWWKKLSTWLAGLAASMIASALGVTGLAAVTVLPKSIILGIALIAVILVPVATSISQWPVDETMVEEKEVKEDGV